MPRRSLMWIAVVVAVSTACYHRAGSPESRYLSEIMRRIDRNYLEPVDRRQLYEGAVEGMLEKLDENSAYIGRGEVARFQEMLRQEFVGIGIEPIIDPKSGRLSVNSPLAGSPAFKTGLRAGDRILKIDGFDTTGLSLDDAVPRLRGERGSAVVLVVERDGLDKPLEVRIVRDTIQVESVLGDVRKSDGSWDFMLGRKARIAYVRIASFGEHTAEEFEKQLTALDAAGLDGLVIDLRSNPGGVLDAATAVCEQLIERGKLIVSTRGRGGSLKEECHAQADSPHLSFPVVVLVNRRSASASEIVAACLQDHGRGKVAGERTYGKGTVQRPIYVEWGKSQLKLTTASYWRPSGRNIHRLRDSSEADDWGVRPDTGYEVLLTDDLVDKWQTWRRQRDAVPRPDESPRPPAVESDSVLARGVEYLEAERAARAKTAAAK